jgi:predicted membrane protein
MNAFENAMANPISAGIFIIALIVLVAILYFFPAYTAKRRKHVNASAIFILNLFLGWTFIGWVVALVWSYTAQAKKE